MTKLSQKVVAALSAGVMLLSMASSVAAQTTLDITGNGSDTTSTINLTQTSTTTVVQNNSADIHNDVNASADTGSNDANRNTGGATTIDTGNAQTNVTVANAVNSNSANVNCCSANNDTSVLISGNGTGSKNDVKLDQGSTSSVGVFQDNQANIKNDVDAKANSGKNDAKSNTGGDVTVSTGDATTNVDVTNAANANWATIGGGAHVGTGMVDLKIVGNGSDTKNTIALNLDHSVTVTQDNSAHITNDVDANANTGKNDANRNTGGEVLIDTGNATTTVGIDNAVNFNSASSDCGCVIDVTGKIAANGDDSTNAIVASLGSDLGVFQDNCGTTGQGSVLLDYLRKGCSLNNEVDAHAGSGKNDNNSNTGTPLGGDPEIWTGSADSTTGISNSGNANAFGVAVTPEWPSFDFNFNVSSLNWMALWALLGH